MSKEALSLPVKLATDSEVFDFIEVRTKSTHVLLENCPTVSGTMFERLSKHKEPAEQTRIISSVFQNSQETHTDETMLETLKGHLVGSLDSNSIKFTLELTFGGDENLKVHTMVYLIGKSLTIVNYADKMPASDGLHTLHIDSLVKDLLENHKVSANQLEFQVVNIVKNPSESSMHDPNEYELISDKFTRTSGEQVSPHFVYVTKTKNTLDSVSSGKFDTSKFSNIELSFVDSRPFLDPIKFENVPKDLSGIVKNFQEQCKKSNVLQQKGFSAIQERLLPQKAYENQLGMAAFYRGAFSGMALVQPTPRDDPQKGTLYLTRRNLDEHVPGKHFVHVAQLKNGVQSLDASIKQPRSSMMMEGNRLMVVSTIANLNQNRVVQTKHLCIKNAGQKLQVISKRRR